ncbi:hypothetical protein GN156_16200 [bacterium LRH843]|nr:hypothetical protein [bacterium LRH843]
MPHQHKNNKKGAGDLARNEDKNKKETGNLPDNRDKNNKGAGNLPDNRDKYKSFYRELRKYKGELVSIRTKTGHTILGELDEVTRDGLVKIIYREMTSPFMEAQLTFIHLEDIESFTVTLPEDELNASII